MAKYEKVSEETEKLFNDVIGNTSIPHWINFELVSNNKSKDVYQVRKMNDLVEKLTEGINFVIIINEEIFDQLQENQQRILFDECLAGVSVSEQDAVSYEKPNFTTYRGVLEKHGHEEIIVLKESVKSLYDKKKEQEDQEKSARKEARARKKENQ
jgi:hypothetical protein